MPMKSGGGDDPFAEGDSGSEPAPAGGSDEPRAVTHDHTLEDALVDALVAIDAGERTGQLSVRHDGYTALLDALEDTGDELERAAEALADELGVDVGEVNRTRVVALAIGVGFDTAAPWALEALRDAQAERAREDL